MVSCLVTVMFVPANLLNRYETWVENGKENLSAEQLDELFNVERNKENTTL